MQGSEELRKVKKILTYVQVRESACKIQNKKEKEQRVRSLEQEKTRRLINNCTMARVCVQKSGTRREKAENGVHANVIVVLYGFDQRNKIKKKQKKK
jgi:hypothetical protein